MKQVPLSTKIDMDPETKTLKRSSALAQVNPDDLHALQCALDLKKLTGAEVVAVTMGPPSAEEVLREALQRGADRGILLTSRAFAGSDTYCTARVLATVAERIGGYGILFFGRMAIDGDTAQVGPEVAGMLGIPQCTYLVSIDKVGNESVVLSKLHGNVVRQMEVQLPCAVMVGKENSLFLSEEVMSTYPYRQLIRVCDRATALNFMKGINGFTLCSGIICEELNGPEYRAVPLTEGGVMRIGYIQRRGSSLTHLGELYLELVRGAMET